jgi:hypothetical protein
MQSYTERISHGARGVNGVFVDGSGRWIRYEEAENASEYYYLDDAGFLSNTGEKHFLKRWAEGKRGNLTEFTIAAPK